MEPSSSASSEHEIFDPASRPPFRVRDRSGGRRHCPPISPRDWPSRAANRALPETGFGQLLTRRSRTWGFPTGREMNPHVLLNVAIEHRLMHAETLAYMLHQLPFDKRDGEHQASAPPAAGPRAADDRNPRGRGHARDCARRSGRASAGTTNTKPRAVNVPAFNIDRYKVTNSEYLKFMEAGGYQDRAYGPRRTGIGKQGRESRIPFLVRTQRTWMLSRHV